MFVFSFDHQEFLRQKNDANCMIDGHLPRPILMAIHESRNSDELAHFPRDAAAASEAIFLHPSRISFRFDSSSFCFFLCCETNCCHLSWINRFFGLEYTGLKTLEREKCINTIASAGGFFKHLGRPYVVRA